MKQSLLKGGTITIETFEIRIEISGRIIFPVSCAVVWYQRLHVSSCKLIFQSPEQRSLYLQNWKSDYILLLLLLLLVLLLLLSFLSFLLFLYIHIYIYIHYHSNIQISSNERSSPRRPDEPGRSPGNAPPSARRSPRSGDRGDRTGAGAAGATAPLGAQRWRKDDRKPRIAIAGHSRTCIHIIFLYVSIIDIYI